MVFENDGYGRGKKDFSPTKYLVKGFLALAIIGVFYYFYVGKMNNSLDSLFGNEDKQPQQEQAVQIWPAELGVVTGILYSEDNPSAVVDKDIVRQGDSIHGVKVVKIHKEQVEFEKAGKRWVQKVKEEPKRELEPDVDEK